MKIFYTDGSASPNPGPGGWAIIDVNTKQPVKSGEIKNLDLVQELYELYNSHDIKLVWVKGHAGEELNELADIAANQARKSI